MPNFTQFVNVLSSGDLPITSDDFITKLVPNFWAFLTQLLAFIVLIILVIVFAYKPVKKIINKRKEYITQNIKSAEDANKVANQKVQEADAMIIKSHSEANDIIAKARIDAVKQSDDIIANAKAESDIERMKAKSDIERAKVDAKDDVRKEIINVAMEASKKVLGREVSSEDNDRLVDDFIKDLSK